MAHPGPEITLLQALTLVLAIYGAVLSTYTVWRARRRDRPALKVSMSHAYGVGALAGGTWLTLTVVNVGHRPVTVCNPGFQLPDGARLISPEEEARLGLPDRLAEGASFALRIPHADVRRAMMERGLREAMVRPVCSDAAGTDFIGKDQRLSIAKLR